MANAIVFAASVHVATARAQDPTFADFPFVIYCEFEVIGHGYFFSQPDPDGRAPYLTPHRQAGVTSIDGVAERVGGHRPGTCKDKTLDDPRAAGQAFDLAR